MLQNYFQYPLTVSTINNNVVISLMACLLLFSGKELSSQSQSSNPFVYLSPLPEARMVNPESSISFRLKNKKKITDMSDFSVTLVGSLSLEIPGNAYIASDGITYIFKPNRPFHPGEMVEVGIKNDEKNTVFSYRFYISNTPLSFQKEILTEIINSSIDFVADQLQPDKTAPNDLPNGLPDITITHFDDPSPGYLFLATMDNKARSDGYLAMYDNLANPVFYRIFPGNTGSDFKIQPNGNLSYHGRTNWEFYEMNPFFDVIDTIRAKNGLLADNHELLLLGNGHKFLLAYDPQLVDMSLIVPGGNPQATVIGLVIQELDENHEVVFQWRSWDHFQITDADDEINLSGSIIDYVHGNSIEIDSDSSMLISSRNMSEVTRINRNNGEIIWRFGGKQNQFQIEDQTQLFCQQHDARIMSGLNHISVFDNGNCHLPHFSCAAEYLLDDQLMTATLVNRLRGNPDIFGSFMGNAQRLDNGRTIVGWGSGIPSITEFDSTGNIHLQFSFNYINYRAFRFNWQSPCLLSNSDSIDFDTIHPGDSTSAQVEITNNFHEQMEINEVFFHGRAFKLTDELPITLSPNETKSFTIRFVPDSLGTFNDVVTFCHDIDTEVLKQRISRQVFLSGNASSNSGIDDPLFLAHFKVYPNPFINQLYVESTTSEITEVFLINYLGKIILHQSFEGRKTVALNLDIVPGIYFVKLGTKDHQKWTTRIIKTDNSF